MANSINLIAFGTFGNPNGFKQTFFVGNKELAKSVRTFDLNTNAIKLFVNTKLYAIRKEYANGFNSVSYSIYTYAREQNSDRSGTFIGSSILLTNKVAEEQVIITQLNEFHSQLVNKNILNDTISVNHSDKLSVIKPKNFDKIEYHLREVEDLDFRQNSDNFLVVFCNINDSNLTQFFEKSLDLLNIYNTIYFTDSRAVAEFVHQKGIFKLIQNVGEKKEFENEIKNFIVERKRIREQSIAEFEREVQRINDDKNKTIQEFKTQIEQSERTHSENESKLKDSRDDINRVGQFYDDFLNKTKSLINQLKQNNGKLDEIKQIHNGNKVLFNNGLSDLKRPNYTTTIAKPKPKGNLHAEHPSQYFNNKSSRIKCSDEEARERGYKINFYKVATLILTFLLLASWIYILFFKSILETEKQATQDPKQVNSIPQEQIQTPVETLTLEDLNPIPNSKLNDNEYRSVAKNLAYKSKIEDVVQIIFDKNPTDIKSNYNGQEHNYSKHLIENNKQCFEEKDGLYYFTKDTIRNIPSLKK